MLATTQTQPLKAREGGAGRVRGGCGAMHLAQPQLLSNEQWRLLLLLLLERGAPLGLGHPLLAAPIAALVLEHLRLVVL